MKEFKGTKGAWTISSNGVYTNEHGAKVMAIDFIGDSSEDCIELYANLDNNEEELRANAKLIASAPDLLELCLLVNNSFGGGNVITFSEQDIKDFQQAINKALK